MIIIMQRKIEKNFTLCPTHKPNYASRQQAIEEVQRKVAIQSEISRQIVAKIQKLNGKIEAQKQLMLCIDPQQQRFKKQIQELITEIKDKQKRQIEDQQKSQENLLKMKKYLESKQNRIQNLKKQKQKYDNVDTSLNNCRANWQKIEQLKIKMDDLDDQIQINDPINFEMQSRQTMHDLQDRLADKKEIINSLIEQINIKEMEENIEKSQLVVEFGKLDELKIETSQKQQHLKSLNRHSQQIRQRIHILQSEQIQLKQKVHINNYASIKDLIDFQQKQNQYLINQLTQIESKIRGEQDCVSNRLNKQKITNQKQYKRNINYQNDDYFHSSQHLIRQSQDFKVKMKEMKDKVQKKEQKIENIKISMIKKEQQINRCKTQLQRLKNQLQSINIENQQQDGDHSLQLQLKQNGQNNENEKQNKIMNHSQKKERQTEMKQKSTPILNKQQSSNSPSKEQIHFARTNKLAIKKQKRQKEEQKNDSKFICTVVLAGLICFIILTISLINS